METHTNAQRQLTGVLQRIKNTPSISLNQEKSAKELEVQGMDTTMLISATP